MANVLTEGGKAYFIHPWSNKTVAVPITEINKSIYAGLRPASNQEYYQHKMGEHYKEQNVEAALAGIARGTTFGLSDIALTKLGMVEPQTLARLKEYNPAISAISDIGSSIGTMFIPGGPMVKAMQLANKAGLKATVQTARLLNQTTAGALPKFAGSVAREGIFGAILGTGTGLSQYAIHEGNLEDIIKATTKGATFGAGLGVLTTGAGIIGGKVKQKYTLGIERIKELRQSRQVLKSELESLKQSGLGSDDVIKIQNEIDKLGVELRQHQVNAVTKLLTRSVAYGVGHAIGGGVTGGLIGVLAAPHVIKGVKKVLSPIGGKVTELGKSIKSKTEGYINSAWDKAQPYAEKIKEAPIINEAVEIGKKEAIKKLKKTAFGKGLISDVGDIAAVANARRRVQALREKAGQLVEKVPGQIGIEAAGHGFGATMTGVALQTPEALATGAMAGGLTGAAIGLGSHLVHDQIKKVTDVLINKMAPAARIAAIKALNKDNLSDWQKEINEIDPESIDPSLRMILPENMPNQFKDSIINRVQKAVNYLQQQQTQDDEILPTGKEKAQDDEKNRKYRRILQAVVNPETVLQSFSDKKLRSDQVNALRAVYPEAYQQLVSMVMSEVSKAKAAGGHYDRQTANQIATLTGNPALRPKMYNPQTVAMLQANFQEQKKQGPKPRARNLEVAQYYQTPMQRIKRGQ